MKVFSDNHLPVADPERITPYIFNALGEILKSEQDIVTAIVRDEKVISRLDMKEEFHYKRHSLY